MPEAGAAPVVMIVCPAADAAAPRQKSTTVTSRTALELNQEPRRRHERYHPFEIALRPQRVPDGAVRLTVVVPAKSVHHLYEQRQPASVERERSRGPQIEPRVGGQANRVAGGREVQVIESAGEVSRKWHVAPDAELGAH